MKIHVSHVHRAPFARRLARPALKGALLTLALAVLAVGLQPGPVSSASAPVWHDADMKSAAGSGTSLAVDRPANVAEGDLVVLVFTQQRSPGTATRGFSTPSGFRAVRTAHDRGGTDRPEAVAFFKVAGPSEPASYSSTVTEFGGSTPNWKAVAARVTGHDPRQPIGASAGVNSGTTSVASVTVPAVTTILDNSLLVAARTVRGEVSAETTPTGMDLEWSANGSGAGDGNGNAPAFRGASQVIGSAGATGTRQFSWTGAARAAGLMFVVNPARSAESPRVNGLFYGDGDDARYAHIATTPGGSKLYAHLGGARFYAAMVVSRSVNDNVHGDGAYTTSAGWSPPHPFNRLVDSEYLGFTLSCGGNSWTWRQGYGAQPESDKNNTNPTWFSDHTAGAGTGTPPPGYESSSSIVANLNNYAAGGSPAWDVTVGGTLSYNNWKSPFAPGFPSDVTKVDGYPAIGQITYSQTYGWEWSMVYEFAVDASVCGANPIQLASINSHHSPAKSGPEDDGITTTETLRDWGDLPSQYPTLAADNGARHNLVVSGAYLGTQPDAEADGQPTASALGDDEHVRDDEDGIVFLTPIVPGSPARIQVTAGTPGYLSAWIDFNGDGTLTQVNLLSSTGPAAVTTGAVGDRHLSAAGVYVFTIDVPGNASGLMYSRWRFTNAADQGGNAVTGLASTGEVEDHALARVGNYVWLDQNGNGLQDEPPSAGVNGVTVRLLYENGDPVLDGSGNPVTTVTAADGGGNPGYYEFSGLPSGVSYRLQFVKPDGYAFTAIDADSQGLTGTANSDAGPSSGITAAFALTAGQTNHAVDAGLVEAASIGDRVWEDGNGNGLQDPGEPGLDGVLVNLYRPGYGPDGIPGTADDDDVVATTLTAAGGAYLFAGLTPGDYYVEVVPPSGYVFTLQNQGVDAGLDSDADPLTGVMATTSLAGGEEDLTWDAGLYRPAAIGNRIWLDENSDGYQDAGEPGLPNVQVNLYGAGGELVATTFTDTDGNYLFGGLPPGTYYVDVLDGTGDQDYSLPSPGMTQTPPSTLAGADFGNQDHGATPIPNTAFSGYAVTVVSGEENLSADFGYNHRPAGEVNGNSGNGAIGDRVWIDADGDGLQDPGEPGLAGVTVTLYHDPDGNGVYDTVYATTTTDATGNYIFNDLPPGAYVVVVTPPQGHTQTGDPDWFGSELPAGEGDHRTTTPIVLAPGDVFLNADFGYQPPAGQSNTVGDRVWFDANADGVQDAGEPGLAGVTVALIADDNGNGVWDPGEPIIAVTVTDGNGEYLFAGLPDGNYLVWVNDTDNVLGGKTPTYDADGGSTYTGGGAPTGVAAGSVLGLSAVALDPDGTNDQPVLDLEQDFGYTAPGQTSTTGLIGDRVWLDMDGDGAQDAAEPGLEGVRVELYDDDGTLLAVTWTDENGLYAFGGLPAGTYTVVVTPPAGMTQTYDADDASGPFTTPHASTVTIGGTEPLVNLQQDFGYRGTGSVGNLVWEDLNADGVWQPGEPGIGGVTLDLYWDLNGNGVIDPGEPLVGRTVSGPDGGYLFAGLPTDDGGGDARYVVVVTDTEGVLHGYWHSLGTAGSDLNSQSDPYAVTLTPQSPHNMTADFGYYVKAAALGNRVWFDANGNGIQDATETGLAGVEVTLTIRYYDGSTVTVVTVTDDDGFYSFGNLLLDEDHASSTTGSPSPHQPVYTISVAAPEGYLPTVLNASGSTSMNDSDAHDGVDALATQGRTDVAANTDDPYAPSAESDPNAGYDFGFAIRDIEVTIECFEFGGTSPFKMATNTVVHTSDSGLSAEGLTMVHTFGPGVTYHSFQVTAAPTGSTTTLVSVDGQTVTLALAGSFAPGDVWQVELLVTFPGGPVQQISNLVSVGTTSAEFNLVNNEDACGATVPVTLAYFHAAATPGGVRFQWTTATETGNVGFQLYAQAPSGLVPLTEHVVPSQALDSLEPLDYELELAGVTATTFHIEDVDVLGRTRLHGPFLVGEAYGERPLAEAIDWAAIGAESRAAAQARAAVEAATAEALLELALADVAALTPAGEHPWQARAAAVPDDLVQVAPDAAPGAGDTHSVGGKRPGTYPVAELRVRRDGVHRVSYETLLLAGIDLAGVPRSRVGLWNRGQPVPVFVSQTYGPGAYVEFFGRALDTLYTDTNVYTLTVSPVTARHVSYDGRAVSHRLTPRGWYWETAQVNRQRQYFFAARGDDPWMDSALLAFPGRPAAANFELQVDGLVAGAAAPRLTVHLVGVTDWPASPDHHVRVLFNGVQVAESWFDGLVDEVISVDLPAGLLLEGKNVLRLVAPGDTGVRHDMVYLDRYGVTYPRAFTARGGVLDFEATGMALRVDGLPSPQVVVYRMDHMGTTKITRPEVSVAGGAFSARFPGVTWPARYVVTTVDALLTPEIAHRRPVANITGGSAQGAAGGGARYLVIAHPDMSQALAPLVAARRAEGLTVRVVDVRDVYAQFGHGVFDPQAIRDYIRFAATNLGTRYVLLGGGDAYDYRDYLGKGALSFIPSLYAQTDFIVRFAPADALFADVDGDGVPDVAIGRLPARTAAEMAGMVAKTLAYGSKTYGRSAVFAADKDDTGAPFTKDSEAFLASLPDGWRVTRAYMGPMGKAAARAALLGALNEGVALTSFVGHSGPTDWTFDRLFTAADAAALTNAGKPTVVTQWGCWNTYYVSPGAETLAHRFLLSGDRGAAAVLGASTLTLASSEQKLGLLLTPRLARPGMRIGDAVLQAKQQLARQSPGLPDVQLGWTLLGDPALMVDGGAP